MIRGKRKKLAPNENLQSILAANAGLPDWRVKLRRPRYRVAVAYHWLDDNGKDVWAEFECRQRYYRDNQGEYRLGTVVTYRRQSEKPRGGFIADGKAYSIMRPSGDFVRTSYAFEQGKTINVPDDIVVAFREIWHINIDRELPREAYNKWKRENLPQQQSG